MPDFAAFRRDLDGILVQRDPAALRAFLIEQGQWDQATTMDPEAAMWLMIATSPALAHLHAEARAWLRAHGRGDDAAALDEGPVGGNQPPRPRPPTGQKPRPRTPRKPQG